MKKTELSDRDFRADARRLAAVRPRLELRDRIIRSLRRCFAAEGFVEVDTPVRVVAPAPERHIEAIAAGDRFLITSPELHMKRMLQAGYDRIFQFCHCFRDGERGPLHLPEFTMVEWYRLGGTIADLMRDCERLLGAAAQYIGVYPVVTRGEHAVDLTPPFEVLEVRDAFERYAGWRPGAAPDGERFDRDLVDQVEPFLPADRPVFLAGYPAAMASLARIDPADPARAERFEMYAGGMELANGFQELTDSAEQRRRFEAERRERVSDGKRAYPLDERFLGALGLGLPECAGIALGVDRLVMLLTGAPTIDDVVAFPDG